MLMNSDDFAMSCMGALFVKGSSALLHDIR
jgi:hypothetical protein